MTLTFTYEQLKNKDYKITFECNVLVGLEAIAKASYETAAKPKAGYGSRANEDLKFDFSRFLHLEDHIGKDLHNVLKMTTVGGRVCETYIHVVPGDSYILDYAILQDVHRDGKEILETAKSILEKKLKEELVKK